MDRLKKVLAAMLLGALPTGAVAQDAAGQPAKSPSESPDREAKPDDAKRQALIESLRALRREPEKVPFHSAMCYDMTMPPESVSYVCDTCSSTTELPYRGLGQLSREVPYLVRSLADLPVKVHLDASPLCSKCGAGKTPGIELTTDCGECGKSFTWSVSTEGEKDRLRLLFVAHPITSFDAGPRGMGDDGPDPKRVIENAEYIASHLFCEDCRKKLGLTSPAK